MAFSVSIEDTYFEEVRDHCNLLLSIDPEFIAKNVSVRDIEKLMRCFDIAEYQDGQLHVRFRRTWSPRLGRYVTHGTRERARAILRFEVLRWKIFEEVQAHVQKRKSIKRRSEGYGEGDGEGSSISESSSFSSKSSTKSYDPSEMLM